MTETLSPIDALAILADRYPVIAQRLPLALGTRQRLAAEREEHGLSTRLTQRVIKMLVGSTPYLKSVATDGAQRWTLDGEPAEAIDAATAAAALKEVRRRMRAKVKAEPPKQEQAEPPKAKAEPPPKAPPPKAPPLKAPELPKPAVNLAALGRPKLTLKSKAGKSLPAQSASNTVDTQRR